MSTPIPAYWQPDIECMDPEELAQLQLERLEATLSRVYRNVPYYRKSFDAIGFDPDELRAVDELRRLPFTTKADLNASYPYGLFAVPLRDVVRVHTSGGTGAAATVMAYTRNDIKTWSNLNARMLVASGVTKDDVVQITFDYGLLTGAFGVHYGAERLGASVIPISSGNTKRQIKLMQDFKTTTLVATPTYALHLAATMLEMGVNPNALSLEHALLGGEPWSEETRRRIEEQLNVKATDNYALSEVMGPGIAGECLEQSGLHVNEDAFLVEVVHPTTLQPVPRGEPGELVITTLTKEAFPLVRYRTRDLTAVLPEPCACGRTLLRLRRIEQRTDDMLILRGVTVHPSSVEAVLREIGGVEQYQLVVERRGALDEATVVIGMSESVFFDEMKRQSEFREKVRRRLASELGVSFEVKLVDRKTSEGLARKGKVLDLRKHGEGGEAR
jgi:phenylacetate-CoA ligase